MLLSKKGRFDARINMLGAVYSGFDYVFDDIWNRICSNSISRDDFMVMCCSYFDR